MKASVRLPLVSRCWLNCLWLIGISAPVAAQDTTIYSDASLQNGWLNWSWSATVNFGNTIPVYSGSSSAAVTLSGAWGALYLAHPNFNSSTYSNLTFWINGGAGGGQQLQVVGHAGGAAQLATNLPALAINTWQKFSIPLATLGVANRADVDGLWIADRIGSAQPTFYVDAMVLTTNSNPSPIVTLTSPADGAVYSSPASITLSAGVVTNGHVITKVQFYSNSTNLLNEDTAAPYSFTWTGVSPGAYHLTARAIYDAGAIVDSTAANVTVAGNVPVSINVDAQLNRHAISPLIYGVAFASSAAELTDLNAPLHRSGGNAETRYNWLINAHNRGADWYFESIADSSTAIPGGADDDFITESKSGGAEPMLTVPMIGWVPKLAPGTGRGSLASYSVGRYGAQTSTDPYWPDAGNGVALSTGLAITNNDPNDANIPTNSNFQLGWLRHLTNTWGLSTNGGVRYFLMDNEHSIWFGTHQDVHPIGPTMQEIRDRILDYGSLVKSNDPNALVCAPEEWGWNGYFYSGYDQWYGGQYGWGTFPDRTANGGWDYMPWLLNQIHQHDLATGHRLLDYFTLHCYPQGGEGGNDVSTATQLLRNQSTRQFWDTNYVDQSWINSVVMLIPRMKNWAATNYPGTKIGVTEYNWGAEGYINGGTAQADILGIFGRESLDLATRWTVPAAGTPAYLAMKLYRNYDGNKSTFGDTSISAAGPNPDNVSTFAALRSADGAMTLMVINKQLTSGAALSVTLSNFVAGATAQVWQLTSAGAITRLSDVTLAGNTLTDTVPPQSITLFVVPAGTSIPSPILTAAAVTSTNTFTFWLTNGVAGQRYAILSSMDLVSWLPVQTNTLSTSSNSYVFPIPDLLHFYRAQWLP